MAPCIVCIPVCYARSLVNLMLHHSHFSVQTQTQTCRHVFNSHVYGDQTVIKLNITMP